MSYTTTKQPFHGPKPPLESPLYSVAPDGSNAGAPGLEVVIVGAGFCGLTCAIECRLRRMNVTVVELYPTSRTQGDVIDFFGNGGMIVESWDEGRLADKLMKMCINRNDTFKFFNAKNELLCEDAWHQYPHHVRRQVCISPSAFDYDPAVLEQRKADSNMCLSLVYFTNLYITVRWSPWRDP